MYRYVLLLAFALSAPVVAGAPPLSIFTSLGLTGEEISAVDAGRPIAKVLSWGGPSELYVFGAVHVDGLPETYLRAAREVERLNGVSGYMGVGEVGERGT